MQFTSAIIAVLAVAVTAVPTGENQPTTKGAQSKCSPNQTASCCNDPKDSVSCSPINTASILPISSVCKQNQVVACCDNTQNGLINVNLACIPINLDVL